MTPHVAKRMAPTYGALGSLGGVLLILFVRGASDWSTLLAWTFYGLLAASLVLGIVSLCVAVGSKSLDPLKRAFAYAAFVLPIAFGAFLVWVISTVAQYAS